MHLGVGAQLYSTVVVEMVELLVMRHAKSAWDTDAATDFDRPLAARGLRDRVTMAHWLVDGGLVPDRVVSSAAVRARMTAEQVVNTCGLPAASVEYDRRLYSAGVRGWIDRVRGQDPAQRVLICGHNPTFDDLVETLATAPPPRTESNKLMTTAAIAHLRFDSPWTEVGPGSGELIALVRPRELG